MDALLDAALRQVALDLQDRIFLRPAVTAAGPDGPDPDEATVFENAVPTSAGGVVVDWGSLTLAQTLWVQHVAFSLLPAVSRSFRETAVALRDDLTLHFPHRESELPPVSSVAAEQYLASARNRMVAVGDTLWTNIRDQLQAGTDAGESIDQLQARLVTAAGLTEPRARVVARTEVIGASNQGSIAQARVGETAGLQIEKEWLATEDARTRPTHSIADGQVVPLAGKFEVGGYLLDVPGDPTGPPEEVINCRCTPVYNVTDPDEGAVPALTATGGATVTNTVTYVDPAGARVTLGPGDRFTPAQARQFTAGELRLALEDEADDAAPEEVAEQTGAMVALVPSAADVARLALPGGEPEAELHLTLLFLGQAADYGLLQRTAVLAAAQEAALNTTAVQATGFGAAVWNPTGATPALVLQVGRTDECGCLRDALLDAGLGALEELIPEQHVPYAPHVCLAYGTPDALVARMPAALERVGPVLFDRLRVAFGPEVVDLPLVYDPGDLPPQK